MLIRTLIIFVSIISIISCKTLQLDRKIIKTKILSEKKLVDSIMANEFHIKWMKSRGNINLKFEEKEETIDFNLRLRKDSLIWLNISKFRKKIARSKISKDSILLALEYPEKSFYNSSIEKIAYDIGISFSYRLLENLFTGGSFLNSLDKFSFSIEEDQYHINSKIKKERTIIFQSWINPATFKTNRINLFDPKSKTEIDLLFLDWSIIDSANVPLKIRGVLKTNSSEYSLELNHKSIKFDSPLKFPTINVDEKYQPLIIND
tara:strand:- start:1821 stop:2606 length:786 start_codon:yes stop_codon:yes gene_type:complete